MRVCHISSAHPDGDVRIFHKECVSLAKAGYEVFLVLANTKSRTENGVHIVGVDSVYNSRRERMTKTVEDVADAAIKINADVYHFHDPELLKIAKRFKKNGKKIIYDAHEDLPRQILGKHWIPKPLRVTISRVMEAYENSIAKKSTAVVCATPFIKKRFKKVNLNSFDINNYPIVANQDSDAKNNSPVKKDLVTYIGGITRIRGIIEIIKSVEKADVTLELAGKFDSEELLEECRKLSGWKNVNFHGFIGREEINQLLKRTGVGLVLLHPTPNYLDSLPVKMFEYMYAEIPIIASNFPLWIEIINEVNCGVYVDPFNIDQIAIEIKQLLRNPELSEKMGENGKKAVLEKYNWKNEEKKLLELYANL